jgi:CheY-like chemotaxis protein
MSRGNLLIVDDEPSLCFSLRIIFTALGYDVRVANNGHLALAEIEIFSPDILVSDLYMPEMSGFELLSRVASEYPSIRTVAMCAIFVDGEIPEGVTAHAFHRKGAGADSLVSLIQSMSADLDLPSSDALSKRTKPFIVHPDRH